MFFKKKQSSCGWGGSCSPSVEGNKEKSNNTRIKILGTGCNNCKKLEENTLKAHSDRQWIERRARELGYVYIDDVGLESVKWNTVLSI